MNRVLILVPTYNESETIARLIDRISKVRVELSLMPHNKACDIDLLVIDDGSPDGTADLVEGMNIKWVRVMRRTVKGGLGPAYIAGFRKMLSESYQLVVEMDADLSHQPESLVDLLMPVINDEAQLTIGTRWMPGGSVVNWPLSRQLISRIGTGYARIALGLSLRDVTSGYRVFHRSVIEKINFDLIEAQGYGFQIEMIMRTLENGFVVKEVPITFVEREGGVSKMSKRIVFEALWKVTAWGFQRLTKHR